MGGGRIEATGAAAATARRTNVSTTPWVVAELKLHQIGPGCPTAARFHHPMGGGRIEARAAANFARRAAFVSTTPWVVAELKRRFRQPGIPRPARFPPPHGWWPN